MIARLAAAGLLLAAAVSLYASSGAESVQPVRALEVAPGVVWEGQQHADSDRKGRVFIIRLRREPREILVYPVEGRELGEPRALEARPLGAPETLRDAAMNEHGDWVGLFDGEVRWFPSGEEEAVPAPRWNPMAVEILEGRPVVAVFPSPIGRWAGDERTGSAPLVLEADRHRWRTVVPSELLSLPDQSDRAALIQNHRAQLYVDADGNLWLANRYLYRISKYSPAGRQLLSLEADGAEVRHRAVEEVEGQRSHLEEKRADYAEPGRARIATNTAVSAILNLVEGRDGRLYILAKDSGEPSSGLVLDRLDPVRGRLERVSLGFTTPGSASLVSGRDGLYVIPFNGRQRRYLIPWESLGEAEWLPLDGVEGLSAVREEPR